MWNTEILGRTPQFRKAECIHADVVKDTFEGISIFRSFRIKSCDFARVGETEAGGKTLESFREHAQRVFATPPLLLVWGEILPGLEILLKQVKCGLAPIAFIPIVTSASDRVPF